MQMVALRTMHMSTSTLQPEMMWGGGRKLVKCGLQVKLEHFHMAELYFAENG